MSHRTYVSTPPVGEVWQLVSTAIYQMSIEEKRGPRYISANGLSNYYKKYIPLLIGTWKPTFKTKLSVSKPCSWRYVQNNRKPRLTKLGPPKFLVLVYVKPCRLGWACAVLVGRPPSPASRFSDPQQTQLPGKPLLIFPVSLTSAFQNR